MDDSKPWCDCDDAAIPCPKGQGCRTPPVLSYSKAGAVQPGSEGQTGTGCTCFGSGGCVHCNRVVDMHAWRVDHSPHESGYAQCTWCCKVWLAVVPCPAPAALWCPDCRKATALFPVPVPLLPPVCEG